MSAKFYILLALPFVVIAGVFAFMIWVGKGKSPRVTAFADKLGVLNGMGKADEMERIGYQAAAIGRCILRTQYGKVLLLEDIYRMSERTATMFERMLASSLNESTDAVRNVLTMDDEVDVLYEQIYRECITRQSGLRSQDSDVMTAVNVAQYIEHVGDHIVNWARWWLYFVGEQDSDIIV